MGLQLPREMMEAREPRQPAAATAGSSALWMLLCAALSLFCAWQLFGLPGGVLKQVRVPEDMLEFGFGISSVQVAEDGSWIIRRQAYVDRMGRYDIDPQGGLRRSKERGLASEPNRTGTMSQPFLRMEGHSYIDISPGPAYHLQRREQRRLAGKLSHHGKPLLTDETDPRTPVGPVDKLETKVIGEPARSGHYVAVNILRVSRWTPNEHLPETLRGEAELEYQLLEGHDYYAVIDSAAYKAPDLWLTTDKGQYLHHVHASEASGELEVKVLKTVELKAVLPVQTHSVILGHDPGTSRLFLVLANGQRLWFDPQSLACLGNDQLPGDWEREYGALTTDVVQRLEFPNYNMESGWPLTESRFKAVQGGMVLVMLGGLLALACLWRTPWKFISAATTADSR